MAEVVARVRQILEELGLPREQAPDSLIEAAILAVRRVHSMSHREIYGFEPDEAVKEETKIG